VARLLPIELPGAWYHVVNRGARNRPVFRATADRDDFLRLVAEIRARFAVECHAYCLMDSHYHLLVRTPRPNLDRAMNRLDGAYTGRFHRHHGTAGALFRGPYRAVEVRADRHLLRVSRYVHLNPVLAGLAARPEDWPFSSYSAYVEPARTPPWLTTATILRHFGSVGARRRYRAFVEDGLDPGTRDRHGRARMPQVVGDERFRDELLRRAALEPTGDRGELGGPRSPGGCAVATLAAIARAVCETLEVPHDALSPGSHRGREHALARGVFALAARRCGGYRLREIAAWLGYASHVAVARAAIRCGEAARSDPRLQERIGLVLDRLARRPVPELGGSEAQVGSRRNRSTT
jgi:REP element-mobilizing transposase RayT